MLDTNFRYSACNWWLKHSVVAVPTKADGTLQTCCRHCYRLPTTADMADVTFHKY